MIAQPGAAVEPALGQTPHDPGRAAVRDGRDRHHGHRVWPGKWQFQHRDRHSAGQVGDHPGPSGLPRRPGRAGWLARGEPGICGAPPRGHRRPGRLRLRRVIAKEGARQCSLCARPGMTGEAAGCPELPGLALASRLGRDARLRHPGLCPPRRHPCPPIRMWPHHRNFAEISSLSPGSIRHGKV